VAEEEEETMAAAVGTGAVTPHLPAPPHAGPEAQEGWVCPQFVGSHFHPLQPKDAGGGRSTPDQQHSAAAEHSTPVGRREAGEGRGVRLVLKRATVELLGVYKKCTAEFKYQTSLNPRRCLTKPSETEGDGVSTCHVLQLVEFLSFASLSYLETPNLADKSV